MKIRIRRQAVVLECDPWDMIFGASIVADEECGEVAVLAELYRVMSAPKRRRLHKAWSLAHAHGWMCDDDNSDWLVDALEVSRDHCRAEIVGRIQEDIGLNSETPKARRAGRTLMRVVQRMDDLSLIVFFYGLGRAEPDASGGVAFT